jgi:hypothetical protein
MQGPARSSYLADVCFAYCSTLKIEAIYSSETYVDFQPITRGYIPETLQLQLRPVYALPSSSLSARRAMFMKELISFSIRFIAQLKLRQLLQGRLS